MFKTKNQLCRHNQIKFITLLKAVCVQLRIGPFFYFTRKFVMSYDMSTDPASGPLFLEASYLRALGRIAQKHHTVTDKHYSYDMELRLWTKC